MRLTLALAVACLGIVGIATADPAHASIKQHTEIPAQGLGPALTTLAKEFEFQVLYRTEVVGALRTHGAAGEFTPDEALKQVLSV
jgi:iron complex outermembrane recepter protein